MSSDRRRLPWGQILGGLVLLALGVDIGIRIGSRGAPAPPTAPSTSEAARPAEPRSTNTDAQRPDTSALALAAARRAASASDDPPPDPLRQRAAMIEMRWLSVPPLHNNPAHEPPLPPLEPAADALREKAARARKNGDWDLAVDLYSKAEAATTEPRHQEELRLGRLRTLVDARRFDAAKELAEAIGAKPVRSAARVEAAEILARIEDAEARGR